MRRAPVKKVKEASVPWEENPAPTKPKRPILDLPQIFVYHDFHMHTAIECERVKDTVRFIPFDAEDGLQVKSMAIKDFDQRYKPLIDYPVERAAKLYLQYATHLGATRDALNHLGRHTQITQGEIAMATREKNSKEETKKTAPVKKVAAEKKAAEPKAVPEKKAPKAAPEKKVAASKGEKTKPYSAAQMFKDLIMEGKLTDERIFKEVQDKFGLDDSKAGYVKWYRNNLIKTGVKNVPDAKVK